MASDHLQRRILLLAGLHLALTGLLGVAAWRAAVLGRPTLLAVPFAVAVAAVGSLRMNVEFGRHACTVTMVEAVMVTMLLHLAPASVVAAAVLGEALACAVRRQAFLKLLYNTGSATWAAMLAALVFELLGAGASWDDRAWVAALVAGCVYATATHGCTSAVLAVVEGLRFPQVFVASVVPVAIASVVSAAMGLVAVVLVGVTPGAVVLLAPFFLVMVAETRRLAHQRDEQLRFERLYAASARTGTLTGLTEVMTTLAGEGRSLVTGAVGLCCTMDGDGQWSGVVVRDDGAVPVPAAALASVVALSSGGAGGEVPADRVPAAIRALLPSMSSLLVARSDQTAAAPVVLAVLRQLSADGGAHWRAEVLAAFMGHAALTVANARLYADVEAALAHQVDLNRQKDDFVSAVSHELRTPLTAVIGSVLTLRRMDDRLRPEQRTKLVDVSFRQARRLQRLVEELLTLATVEHGERPAADEPVSVGRMVDDITDELRVQRADQILPPIRFVDAGVGTVRSAEQKLRQVVSNLIENACKYAPGSPIDVRLEPGDRGTVLIRVIDYGPGIRPADHERIFERFVQLDQSSTRSQGGTGLGLYLCRQVATALGGTLGLSEAPGGGCCFTLTLPWAKEPDGGDERRLRAGELIGAATTGGST